MNTDDRNLFRTLAPPPDGVERFRIRLGDVDARTRPMPARRFIAAGLAAALIATVVITVNWSPGSGDPPGASVAAPPVAGNTGQMAVTVDDSHVTPPRAALREATALPGAAIPEATIVPESTAPSEVADIRGAPALARLLGQPPRPTETRIAIDDMQVAIAEIPSTNSKVRLYQVSSN